MPANCCVWLVTASLPLVLWIVRRLLPSLSLPLYLVLIALPLLLPGPTRRNKSQTKREKRE